MQPQGQPTPAATRLCYVRACRAAVGDIRELSRQTGLSLRTGAIEIADRCSLVAVPESADDDVIAALRQYSIKGKRAAVCRERCPTRLPVRQRPPPRW